MRLQLTVAWGEHLPFDLVNVVGYSALEYIHLLLFDKLSEWYDFFLIEQRHEVVAETPDLAVSMHDELFLILAVVLFENGCLARQLVKVDLGLGSGTFPGQLL